jgi:hypothetical protein
MAPRHGKSEASGTCQQLFCSIRADHQCNHALTVRFLFFFFTFEIRETKEGARLRPWRATCVPNVIKVTKG